MSEPEGPGAAPDRPAPGSWPAGPTGPAAEGEVAWTPEAEARLRRAPGFLRGMVRRLAERRARAEGLGVITPELLGRYKAELMGSAPPGAVGPAVRWTPEAEALLGAVPEFMRPITRRICEELAREAGRAEVTPELIQDAEAQASAESAAVPLPWTADAEALLLQRLGRAPALMADLVLRLFRQDVEAEARRRGAPVVTAEVFRAAWTAADEDPVEWAPEAWARLQTAPEFVREGIRKAAERRARRMGVRVITSPLLTRFRNQAMMRAVRRIRELGFSELTFDAFDVARERIRLIRLNPEAQERLDRIRRYFAEERQGRPGDTLGEELMRRFRAYLRDPAGAPLPAEEEEEAGPAAPGPEGGVVKRYRDIAGDGGSNILGQVAAQQARLLARLGRIRHVVAVVSGKGGVGKSSLTAGLATVLAGEGWTVGALDADLNGPSLAKLLGVRGQRLRLGPEGVEPARARNGVRVLSMDLLLASDDSPVVWDAPTQAEAHTWRGAMEASALREFLTDTDWGTLDLLLLDLPPGADRLPVVAGMVPGLRALVVTLPSDVSQLVVRRGIALAREAGVAMLGLVENMAGYVCPHCGNLGPLFPGRGGETLAAACGVPFLGAIPFDPALAAALDAGRPPGSEPGAGRAAEALIALGRRLREGLEAPERTVG